LWMRRKVEGKGGRGLSHTSQEDGKKALIGQAIKEL